MCCWPANQPAAFGPGGYHWFSQLTWPKTQLCFEQWVIVGPVPLGRDLNGRCYDCHCWCTSLVWRFCTKIGCAFLSVGRYHGSGRSTWDTQRIWKQSGPEGSSQRADSQQMDRIQPKWVVVEVEKKTQIHSYFKTKSVSLGEKSDIRN